MEKDGQCCESSRDFRGEEAELDTRRRQEIVLHPSMKTGAGEDRKLVRGKDDRQHGGGEQQDQPKNLCDHCTRN